MRKRKKRTSLHRRGYTVNVFVNPEPKKHSVIISWGTLTLALVAFVTLAFSIYMSYITQKLVKITERPHIAFIGDTAVTETLVEEGKKVTKISLKLKNIGKRPAVRVTFRWGYSLTNEIDNFIVGAPVDVASHLDPEMPINLNLQLAPFSLIDKEADLESAKAVVFIYVIARYYDEYKPDNEYIDEFWQKYLTGNNKTNFMMLQEMDSFAPFVYKLFPKTK